MASRMQASVRRLVILSLKAFLRLEKFYSAAVELPAKGAAAGLLASLGLCPAQRPAFSGPAVPVPVPVAVSGPAPGPTQQLACKCVGNAAAHQHH